MNVPFLQDTTFTGLISTKGYGTSQEWSQAYSLIQTNSALWSNDTKSLWGSISGSLSAQTDIWSYLSAETFSPSQLTAFLATNSITLCSIDVKGQLLSAGTDLFNIFLTLTLTNTLTGQLVTNTDFNNYQTNVANTTATLLPTTTYQSASGTFASKVEQRQHSQFTSGDYAVQQGRNVELAFSAGASNTIVTITLPRQDTNDNAQSGDELLIRLNGVNTNSTVTIRQYQYGGSLPYLPTTYNIVTFNEKTPPQTIRLRLVGPVWTLISTPNLFSPSTIGNITPSTGTFTTLSATSTITTSAINLQTVPLSTVTFTGETKTSTTSVTATDVYVKVIVNNETKYLRLFDVI